MKKLFTLVLLGILPVLAYSAPAADDFRNAISKVAQSSGGCVVSISSTVKEKLGGGLYFGSPFDSLGDDNFRSFFEEFFGQSVPEREFKRQGLGSGVIIDKNGYILTNEHVVGEASEIKVKLADGREFSAELKGMDKRSDLAIIRINAQNLPVAKLGDSDSLKIGAWVVAIGNPFGFAIENPEPTVTVGVISALHRYLPVLGRRTRNYDDLIQTDAAINPGNSGGPLVDLDGAVIGINTAIITTSGGYQGLGFAIPVNKAKHVIQRLIKGEKILYGWLGVSVQDINDDLRAYFSIAKGSEGVLVVKVYKDSPAAKSGIKEGDVIATFDAKAVRTTKDLLNMVATAEVGRSIVLGLVRDQKARDVTVTVGKRPSDEEESLPPEAPAVSGAFRGMTADEVSPAYRQQFDLSETSGVVVVNLEEDSPAAKSGLMVGDVILEIDKRPVKKLADFNTAVARVKGNCLIKTGRGYFVVKAQ